MAIIGACLGKVSVSHCQLCTQHYLAYCTCGHLQFCFMHSQAVHSASCWDRALCTVLQAISWGLRFAYQQSHAALCDLRGAKATCVCWIDAAWVTADACRDRGRCLPMLAVQQCLSRTCNNIWLQDLNLWRLNEQAHLHQPPVPGMSWVFKPRTSARQGERCCMVGPRSLAAPSARCGLYVYLNGLCSLWVKASKITGHAGTLLGFLSCAVLASAAINIPLHRCTGQLLGVHCLNCATNNLMRVLLSGRIVQCVNWAQIKAKGHCSSMAAFDLLGCGLVQRQTQIGLAEIPSQLGLAGLPSGQTTSDDLELMHGVAQSLPAHATVLQRRRVSCKVCPSCSSA